MKNKEFEYPAISDGLPYRPGQVFASEYFLDNTAQLPKFIDYYDSSTGQIITVQVGVQKDGKR
jgi:hypothetical protein